MVLVPQPWAPTTISRAWHERGHPGRDHLEPAQACTCGRLTDHLPCPPVQEVHQVDVGIVSVIPKPRRWPCRHTITILITGLLLRRAD